MIQVKSVFYSINELQGRQYIVWNNNVIVRKAYVVYGGKLLFMLLHQKIGELLCLFLQYLLIKQLANQFGQESVV